MLFLIIPNDTKRQFTLNGDGIHVLGSRAPIHIQNSQFYGMLDDGINLHARAAYAKRIFMGGPKEDVPILSFHPGGRVSAL